MENTSSLLDFARARGVAMGSVHQGQHLGFTTDEARAERIRLAGGRVQGCYNITGPRGWEVSFARGAAVATAPS